LTNHGWITVLISIIIPVFKVEKYLERCLDSVISQTFHDFECILVDDGSPDNCPAICDFFTSKDPRFKVVHKKANEGLPLARKTGLDYSTSNLIFHLDSDDWLEENALEILYQKQTENDYDIVIGNFVSIKPGGSKNYSYYKPEKFENPIVYLLLNNSKYLWGKLYKKYLFNNYIVPKTNVLEDSFVNVQVFSRTRIDKIALVDKIIYNYDTTTNGIIVQLQNKFNYNDYTEFPVINSFFSIKNFMDFNNKRIKSAYYYSLLNDGIIPYIKFNSNLSKNEIKIFYSDYYKQCSFVNYLLFRERIIIPLYNFCFSFGKFYKKILLLLINFKQYILGKG
jgi:glycosyltransferase involved in cell wall biosynthesis